jgi:hypothetical protein
MHSRPGAVPLPFTEVARGIDRNAGRNKTEQQGEYRREIVQAQMEGQVGQADRQYRHLSLAAKTGQGNDRPTAIPITAPSGNRARDEARVAGRPDPARPIASQAQAAEISKSRDRRPGIGSAASARWFPVLAPVCRLRRRWIHR